MTCAFVRLPSCQYRFRWTFTSRFYLSVLTSVLQDCDAICSFHFSIVFVIVSTLWDVCLLGSKPILPNLGYNLCLMYSVHTRSHTWKPFDKSECMLLRNSSLLIHKLRNMVYPRNQSPNGITVTRQPRLRTTQMTNCMEIISDYYRLVEYRDAT